jgi:delta 1-pyrroline-5-carboxylate dehydrogenase
MTLLHDTKYGPERKLAQGCKIAADARWQQMQAALAAKALAELQVLPPSS